MRGSAEEREKCSGETREDRWSRRKKWFPGITVLTWHVMHQMMMYVSVIYLVVMLSAGEVWADDGLPDLIAENGDLTCASVTSYIEKIETSIVSLMEASEEVYIADSLLVQKSQRVYAASSLFVQKPEKVYEAVSLPLQLYGKMNTADSQPAGLVGLSDDQEAGNLLGLEDFDFSDINSFLREDGETELTMEEVMVHLAQGDLSGLCRKVMDSLKAALFAEVSAGGHLIGQVLALGFLGAVFTNFSTVFHNSEISETGFFITYLLLFTFLAASVMESMNIVAGTVGEIQEFMKLLMPSYFLAVAFAGGSVSAVVMYEFTLWIMAVGQWFLGSIALPAIKVYVLLSMAGNLVKEELLSKLTELLGQAVGWGMKILPGLVLGFHVIQSMILPYVDSLKQGAVQKAVSMIPGVGQGAAAMTQLLVGSGVLIKNTMGMAALVILMVLIAMPVLKMLILMVMYQCVAAVMEPVCDKRFVSCVTAAARGQKMMVQVIMAAALILVITVAVVCAGTNVTYYA